MIILERNFHAYSKSLHFSICNFNFVTTLLQAHVCQWQGGEGSAASQGDSQHQRQALLFKRVSLVC